MRLRVLGAGIIGLTCAEELLRRGHAVDVVDPAPGSGASHAAAGMLSPAGELWYGETRLLDLGLRSAAWWPELAHRLQVPLHRTGTLLVGADAGDLQEIDRQAGLLSASGVAVEPLARREVLTREPRLGRVAGGAFLPDDHSIDPRQVVAALLSRLHVATAPTGEADVTVVATGARLPEPWRALVRPVRGEIVRLRTADGPCQVVRALVHGEPVYVVPRADSDEVVVGATSEEHDGPAVVTVEGIHRLLAAARELLPGLDRAELVEAIARDRPGTADNLPLVGRVADDVVLAAGHYRHGVLLAPLTARLVADLVEGGTGEPATDPLRFERSQVWTS